MCVCVCVFVYVCLCMCACVCVCVCVCASLHECAYANWPHRLLLQAPHIKPIKGDSFSDEEKVFFPPSNVARQLQSPAHLESNYTVKDFSVTGRGVRARGQSEIIHSFMRCDY